MSYNLNIVIFNIRFLFITGHLVKTSTFYNADRFLLSRINEEIIIIVVYISHHYICTCIGGHVSVVHQAISYRVLEISSRSRVFLS